MDNDKMPTVEEEFLDALDVLWRQHGNDDPGYKAMLPFAKRIGELQAECNGLNGAGAEREARLIARVTELQAEVERLRADLEDAVNTATGMVFTQSEMRKRLASAYAERDALAKDAARYRWLRKRWGRVAEEYEGDRMTFIGREKNDGEGWYTDPDSVDAAIDAAMAEGER